MSGQQRFASGRTRRLLIASVCVNVFLASAFMVHLFMDAHEAGPPRRPIADQMIERMAKPLPDADAAIVWQLYRMHEAEARMAQSGFDIAWTASRRELANPSFDAAAFRREIVAVRRLRQAIGSVITEVFLEAVPRLSPEARLILSQQD